MATELVSCHHSGQALWASIGSWPPRSTTSVGSHSAKSAIHPSKPRSSAACIFSMAQSWPATVERSTIEVGSRVAPKKV
jgi:hypothetical protein